MCVVEQKPSLLRLKSASQLQPPKRFCAFGASSSQYVCRAGDDIEVRETNSAQAGIVAEFSTAWFSPCERDCVGRKNAYGKKRPRDENVLSVAPLILVELSFSTDRERVVRLSRAALAWLSRSRLLGIFQLVLGRSSLAEPYSGGQYSPLAPETAWL